MLAVRRLCCGWRLLQPDSWPPAYCTIVLAWLTVDAIGHLDIAQPVVGRVERFATARLVSTDYMPRRAPAA
jgi:hypothetical protein